MVLAGAVEGMTGPLGAESEIDPAREAVRLALLKAAERCFGQFGIAKTTMEDIAPGGGGVTGDRLPVLR